MVSLGQHLAMPAFKASRFENTLNFTRDGQVSMRNFYSGVPDPTTPDTVSFAGIELKPVETVFFDDARFVEHVRTWPESTTG